MCVCWVHATQLPSPILDGDRLLDSKDTASDAVTLAHLYSTTHKALLAASLGA
jgi:hypothetical protein